MEKSRSPTGTANHGTCRERPLVAEAGWLVRLKAMAKGNGEEKKFLINGKNNLTAQVSIALPFPSFASSSPSPSPSPSLFLLSSSCLSALSFGQRCSSLCFLLSVVVLGVVIGPLALRLHLSLGCRLLFPRGLIESRRLSYRPLLTPCYLFLKRAPIVTGEKEEKGRGPRHRLI